MRRTCKERLEKAIKETDYWKEKYFLEKQRSTEMKAHEVALFEKIVKYEKEDVERRKNQLLEKDKDLIEKL